MPVYVTDISLWPSLNLPVSPEKTAILGDRKLIVVTLVVKCPLLIFIIYNGRMPVTFDLLLVTP